MSFNFMKEFWFKGLVLTFAILVLSSWALRPVSQGELTQHQSENLSRLAMSVSHLVEKSFEELNLTIRFILKDMESEKSIKNLDSYATPIKALFALDNKNKNLQLTGRELRSLDLSYWASEDLAKTINRIYASSDNTYDLGLQMISSPSGVNYFGYLFLDEGKYYLAVLSLRFAAEWSQDLKFKNTDVVLMNSLGELVYHPEFQYIGTEYNWADQIFNKIDSQTGTASLVSRDNIFFSLAAGQKDIYLVLASKKWAKPYGASFYGKFFLVFLAIGLLLYCLSQYFLTRHLRAASSQAPLASDSSGWSSSESKGLLDKIRRLEIQLAQQSENTGEAKVRKSYYDLKSKSANLIGQIQLLKGQPENSSELLVSLENKARSIYKQIFQLIDEPDISSGQVMPPLPSEAPKDPPRKREIDYSFDEKKSLISFLDDDDRIEITEQDIGDDKILKFSGVDSLLNQEDAASFGYLGNGDEEQLSGEGDSIVERSIQKQLAEQNYGFKKSFNIEDAYLTEQAEKVEKIRVNFSSDESFEHQMSQVDKIIETVDQDINKSTSEIRNVVRKPRLKDLT